MFTLIFDDSSLIFVKAVHCFKAEVDKLMQFLFYSIACSLSVYNITLYMFNLGRGGGSLILVLLEKHPSFLCLCAVCCPWGPGPRAGTGPLWWRCRYRWLPWQVISMVAAFWVVMMFIFTFSLAWKYCKKRSYLITEASLKLCYYSTLSALALTSIWEKWRRKNKWIRWAFFLHRIRWLILITQNFCTTGHCFLQNTFASATIFTAFVFVLNPFKRSLALAVV